MNIIALKKIDDHICTSWFQWSPPLLPQFCSWKEKALGQHITFFMLLSSYGLPFITFFMLCSFYGLPRENYDTCVHILGFATILDVLGRPQCFINAAWVDPSELIWQYLFLMPPNLLWKFSLVDSNSSDHITSIINAFFSFFATSGYLGSLNKWFWNKIPRNWHCPNPHLFVSYVLYVPV